MTQFKSGDLAMCAEMSVPGINKYIEMGLLAPVAGARTDFINFFDIRQVPQFFVLKMLREMDFTQQQVLEYGRNHTPETVKEMFSGFSERLVEEIAALEKKLDVFRSYVALIEEGRIAEPGKIELRSLPEQPIRCSAMKSHSGVKKNTECLRRTFWDIRQDGNPACPMGFAFNEFFDLLENPTEPAQLVSFDPQGPEIRPADEYLVGTIRSYYGEKHALPQRMAQYALKNGLELHGPAYMVYLLDAISVTGTDEYLLQIAVKAKRKENEGN